MPDWIESIGDYALSYIEETNVRLPKIIFGLNSKLTDVGEGAFEGTAFQQIEFPRSVRCIGMYALAECKNLESVDIWVNEDKEKQVVLDYGVFNGTDALSTISLHYFSDEENLMLFGAAPFSDAQSRISAYSNAEDLSSKLMDENLQKMYGIKAGVNIIVDDSNVKKRSSRNMRIGSAVEYSTDVEYVTIDV